MRYAIFSDIHGNLEALNAVLKDLQGQQIDDYFCCGDIVGYGADPSKCIQRIQEIKAANVAGNHDWAVAQKSQSTRLNAFARESILWTIGMISDEEKKFLSESNLVLKNDDFVLVHGTLNNPEMFHYLLSLFHVQLTFSLLDRLVCFVGHSHVQEVFVEKEDTVDRIDSYSIDLDPECRYLVNVGSVGQPRDRHPDAAYCVYDTKEKTIELKRVSYDIKKAQDKIIAAGLPEVLASRLFLGL
ncbi:MAG: metallophosphoesterase family protein [Candidatus Omnitrophica bacterium]|nr:metallophosphoesterase family protein [Candidatus Omnitrophota bacterium]